MNFSCSAIYSMRHFLTWYILTLAVNLISLKNVHILHDQHIDFGCFCCVFGCGGTPSRIYRIRVKCDCFQGDMRGFLFLSRSSVISQDYISIAANPAWWDPGRHADGNIVALTTRAYPSGPHRHGRDDPNHAAGRRSTATAGSSSDDNVAVGCDSDVWLWTVHSVAGSVKWVCSRTAAVPKYAQ